MPICRHARRSFRRRRLGEWRVPGEFGKRVTVDQGQHDPVRERSRHVRVSRRRRDRIELPAGAQPGSRGFFVWNSEVGKKTLGAGFFLFDYVCCNRIIWGADQYTEVRIRHTKGAPDRWLEEVTPVLPEYSHGSAKPVIQAIEERAQRSWTTTSTSSSPTASASAWSSRSRPSTSRRGGRSRPCGTSPSPPLPTHVDPQHRQAARNRTHRR